MTFRWSEWMIYLLSFWIFIKSFTFITSKTCFHSYFILFELYTTSWSRFTSVNYKLYSSVFYIVFYFCEMSILSKCYISRIQYLYFILISVLVIFFVFLFFLDLKHTFCQFFICNHSPLIYLISISKYLGLHLPNFQKFSLSSLFFQRLTTIALYGLFFWSGSVYLDWYFFLSLLTGTCPTARILEYFIGSNSEKWRLCHVAVASNRTTIAYSQSLLCCEDLVSLPWGAFHASGRKTWPAFQPFFSF